MRREYVGEATLPEEEFLTSYRYLASILESMLDAVIVADPDGTIRTVNRAAMELLGYTEEEIIGQAVGIIFEAAAAFFRGSGLAQLVREEAVRDVELTLVGKSGERIPVMFNGSVIREEDGRLSAVVGVARDIRARKRAEEEIQQRNRELAILNAIATVVSQSLNLDEILNTALDKVLELMHLDVGGIYLAAPVRRKLDLVVHRGLSKEFAHEIESVSVDEKTLEVVMAESKLRRFILSVKAVMKDRVELERVLSAMKKEGLSLASGVPVLLQAREEIQGLMIVASRVPRQYSEAELRLLTSIGQQIATAVENARLYEETQQRLSELSALFEVSGSLRGAATVGEMLPIILDKTLEVVAAEAGAIFLVDQVAGEMVVPVVRGPMEEALVGRSFPLAGTLTERMSRTGKPDLSPDLAADLRMPEEMRAMFRGTGTGIGLPLRAADAPVGMMAVSWLVPHAVSDDEIHLLTAIADMAASAIYRANLFEQLQARLHGLSTLYEAGKTITATLRIGDVQDFIVGAASETLRAEGSYLFLWDEREETLVMRAAWGFLPEVVGQVKCRLGEGLSGWVFLEGKPVNIPDVAQDPRWKPEPDYEAFLSTGRIVSALAVPLVVGARTLGVLGVVNKTADGRRPKVVSFTPADESLLTTLAGQVAIAIENARLYEDVRDLSLGAIRSLASAIDARDPCTRGHSEQVARLSVLLAQELGWQGADLEMLEFAALLHDVGKIGIPDAILKKTEPLTRDEWNSIHLHPYQSAQMVKPVEPLQRIVPWIYHHQERWDGSGYPDGLKGERIPLASRIIAVADAFNAMTTDRPYRKAKSREEAIEELRRRAGTQFDPQVVEVFLELVVGEG